MPDDLHTSIFNIKADENFIDLFDIALLKGRFFTSMDENRDLVVINEKMVKMMGTGDPIGQIIRRGDEEYEIIGVVEDFNFQHLSNDIRPMLFMCNRAHRRLFVHYNPESRGIREDIQENLSAMYGIPVDFSFISESLDKLYAGETQMLTAVLFFTLLCILLSSLGLFGLVSHSTREKRGEIAVRKVFGATSGNVMIFQVWKIFRLFLPATIIGGVLAWYMMNRWLENFAYRNNIEVWVFILGPLMILFIGFLSVGYQTWRASRQLPVNALKQP